MEDTQEQDHDICAESMHAYGASFILDAVALIIGSLLLLLFFLRFLHHEYVNRDNAEHQRMSLTIRLLFAFQIIFTMLWFMSDLIRNVIDPLIGITSDSMWCEVTAYASRLIPSLFYSVYGWGIVIRIELSFVGSFLEVPRWEIITLKTLILVTAFGGFVAWFIIADDVCVNAWTPRDSEAIGGTVMYCQIPWYNDAWLLLIYTVVSAAVMNVVFGLLFGKRLKRILSMTGLDERTHFSKETKLLSVKNGIITIMSTYISFSFSPRVFSLNLNPILVAEYIGVVYWY